VNISFRPLERNDFPIIRNWIDHRLFRRFIPPIDDSQLEVLLPSYSNNQIVDHSIVAYSGDTDNVLGFSHTVIDWKNELAHIQQIVVGEKEFKRCGIGTELMQKTLTECFDNLKLHRAQLFVDEDNTPAVKFYKKIGFHTDGLMREATKFEDQFISWFCMSILKNEWNKS